MTGYHREAVEILHPWILIYDHKCIWASELFQNLEATLVYRNHILSFKELIIWNGKHRHRPARACGEVLQAVLNDLTLNIPTNLQHCFIKDLPSYKQGSITGIPRKKNNISYHLMPSMSKIKHKHRLNSSTHFKQKSFISYPSISQSNFCNISSWNQSTERCCTLDFLL